ncbi:HD domain-containing protein [Myxococcota bacterium]|nr:HD domain-containing protein [Myxococcota bacterium]
MPTFAAIDVGSNAIRLKVVGAESPDRIEERASVRVPVRLGHNVFLTHRLDPRAVDEAVRAFAVFAEHLAQHDVSAYRAVATSAMREAQDRWLLVDRVRRESGLDLEVIGGVEEARLVRLALLQAMPVAGQGTSLLLDLGGGSLELSLLESGRLAWSTSLELGTVRLMEAFLDSGAVHDDQLSLIDEYTLRLLDEALPALRGRRFTRVLGSGGNLEALAEVLPATPGTEPTPAIDATALAAFAAALARRSVEDRVRELGVRRDRAEVIFPAAVILSHLSARLDLRRILVPGAGLRDGLLRELVARHFLAWDERDSDQVALDAARRLGARYAFHASHAEQVRRLSTAVFDDLQPLHRLARRDRLLLEVGALLHDIGDYVAYDRHHKHSAYLVENSEIAGLADAERRVVACLARYHRKSVPQAKHDTFRALDTPDQRRVRWLVPLLRLADALDREHLSRVESLEARVERDRVLLRLYSPHDCALERWTLAAKSGYFQEVYGLRVDTEVVPTGLARRD